MSTSAYPVLTMADLSAWNHGGTGLALLGHPVAHSLSPAIHNAALRMLSTENARFSLWHYYKFDIPPDGLEPSLKLLHAQGFAGLNLTIPHKEAVLEHCESSDAFARAACAANTLVRTNSGWRAHNTDGAGMADALRADLGTGLAGEHVILLGAGGAARAAAVQCLRDHVASLWIGNRSQERLNALLEELSLFAGEIALHGFDLAKPGAGLPSQAIVINATSLGLGPDDPPPIDLRQLPSPKALYDMIYNPGVTPLLRQAAELAVPHANGLSMLVNQGARALSLWTGRPAPVDVMNQAARAALAERNT